MVGPVFAPTSKPDDRRRLLGTTGLAGLVRKAALPIVAIGGMDPARASDALLAGASAVAVVGHVMQAEKPRLALFEMLGAIRACVAKAADVESPRPGSRRTA
jgi:thiamine monophosphate synthase